MLIHAASTPLYTLSPDEALFAYANLLDSFGRFAVPLFFMASGAVLLSRDYDIFEFYKKRLLRIIPTLLFWAVVYLFFRVFAKGEYITLKAALTSFFSGQVYYHLWFLYVIVILYLMAPFMRRLIVAMSGREAFLLLVVWLIVAVILPHIESVSGVKFAFSYREFGAYSGYFVLGFYLSRMHFSKPLAAALMFALSSFAIFYLTGVFSLQKGEFVRLFYDYSSPLVFIQGVSIFLFFKSYDGAKAFKHVAKLAPLVFGVYLVHPIVLEYSDFISDLTLKALFVFCASIGVVKILCYSALKRFL